MCWKIEQDLKEDPLHAAQHGFLKNRSTESAASNVVSYIEKHIYNKQYCIGVFLDISSAFDTIEPDFIRTQLTKKTKNADLVHWYYNYLMHRDMSFEMQGAEKTISNNLGFPQGGVASAKLWILAFNEAMAGTATSVTRLTNVKNS